MTEVTPREIDRIWDALTRHDEKISIMVTAIAVHASACTENEKTRQADRNEMKADLKALLKAAERRAAMTRLARIIWGIGVSAVIGITWFWDHLGPWFLRIVGRTTS